MKTWHVLLLLLLVVCTSAGCGGYGDKGANKNLDKPQPAKK
jgi:hypothetical protein